jgi:PAS domain S-box-containing protein
MSEKQSANKLNLDYLIWNQEKMVNRPIWFHILFPFILTVLATLLKLKSFDHAEQAPFLLFFGVIMISAAYGGTYAAIYATTFTLISTFTFFLYPFIQQGQLKDPILKLVGFLLEAVMVTWLINRLQADHHQLRKSEEKFRSMIEKSDEGFFMTNGSGHILYTSPSINTILGYTALEIKGTDYFNLLHPDDVKSFRYTFINLLSSEKLSLQVRQRIKTRDGDWIWIESAINNLLHDDGVKALVFHFKNITDKVAEEQHQEDFVNIASHELKNPITALKGYMQLLKKRLENNDNLKTMERMEVQVDKLLGLINDMLDTTKIKAGEIQYHYTLFNIVECITECVDAIKCTSCSHIINCNFEPMVKLINGDKDRIGQVITNLITNAIKYSPNGETIEIRSTFEKGNVKVSVSDHGLGIPFEKQKKIFERFYRVDSHPKASIQGLGLGLFISAEIISHHGGQIHVESVENIGSTFWFTLPE